MSRIEISGSYYSTEKGGGGLAEIAKAIGRGQTYRFKLANGSEISVDAARLKASTEKPAKALRAIVGDDFTLIVEENQAIPDGMSAQQKAIFEARRREAAEVLHAPELPYPFKSQWHDALLPLATSSSSPKPLTMGYVPVLLPRLDEAAINGFLADTERRAEILKFVQAFEWNSNAHRITVADVELDRGAALMELLLTTLDRDIRCIDYPEIAAAIPVIREIISTLAKSYSPAHARARTYLTANPSIRDNLPADLLKLFGFESVQAALTARSASIHEWDEVLLPLRRERIDWEDRFSPEKDCPELDSCTLGRNFADDGKCRQILDFVEGFDWSSQAQFKQVRSINVDRVVSLMLIALHLLSSIPSTIQYAEQCSNAKLKAEKEQEQHTLTKIVSTLANRYPPAKAAAAQFFADNPSLKASYDVSLIRVLTSKASD